MEGQELTNEVQQRTCDGMMLFESEVGMYVEKLSDEQIGKTLKLARRVFLGQMTREQAIAEAQGDLMLEFAINAMCNSVLKSKARWQKRVSDGGLNGLKGKLKEQGWTAKRFNDKVSELRSTGLSEEEVIDELKSILRSITIAKQKGLPAGGIGATDSYTRTMADM